MYSHRSTSALAGLERHTDEWLKESDAANTNILCTKNFGMNINRRTPISRLPNGILAMIFEAGQAQGHDSDSPLRFEILVSHVSSHWRNVAIGLPSLWTSIDAFFSPKAPIDILTAIYIKRSRSHPLDISYEARHIPDNVFLARALFLLGAFTANIHRWRRFSLLTRHATIANAVIAYLRKAAPRLEYLSFIVEDLTVGYDDLSDVHIAAAPRLSFLSLRGPISLRCSPSNVKTLHLDETRVCHGRFKEILTLSPCLTHLWLTYLIGLPENTLSTIAIPTLHSLRVEPLSSFVFDLLSALEAPQLDSLLIHDDSGGHLEFDRLNQSQLTTTATKFPNLKSLNFGCFDVAKSRLRQIFGTFPTIEHLSLSTRGHGRISTSVLGDVIECSSGDTVLWPRLHTITIVGDYPDELCTVLQCRKELGFPVSKLYLEGVSYDLLEERGQIAPLQKSVEVEKRDDPPLWPADLTYLFLLDDSGDEDEDEDEVDFTVGDEEEGDSTVEDDSGYYQDDGEDEEVAEDVDDDGSYLE